MNRFKHILFFENDDDFTAWALDPNPVFKHTYQTDDLFQSSSTLPNVNLDALKHKTEGHLVFDFDFKEDYYKELEKGTLFCIKDNNSTIFERKVISYRAASLRVENLIDYVESEEITSRLHK